MWRKFQHTIAKSLKFPINPEKSFRVQSMLFEIQRRGGSLHFTIKKNKNGWVAQCRTIKSIVTGGEDPNATNEAIDRQVKDAIFASFNVPPFLSDDSLIKSGLSSEKELVYVKA